MGQLLVRNVDDDVIERLKKRARLHSVSVEEEHRRVLREALVPARKRKMNFKELLASMPEIPDEFLTRDKSPGRKVQF